MNTKPTLGIPVRRVSAVEAVSEQLTRRILAGEWPPGAALPSLRVLSGQLGVSAVTMREALRLLQAKELVETRHGSGTFVRVPESGEIAGWLINPREVDDYLELIEARQLIEGAILRLAAERRDSSHVDQLRKLVGELRANRLDAVGFLEADLAFHMVVGEAAGNRVLLRSMLAIRGPLRRLMASRTARELAREGTLDRAIPDHEAIAEAIASRDAAPLQGSLDRIVQRARVYLEELRVAESLGPTDTLVVPDPKDSAG